MISFRPLRRSMSICLHLPGKELLKSLTGGPNPIPCTYALLPALPSLLPEVTTVFVGAHALFSNGAVYSRAGTAMVAMMSKTHNVPVVVCCETYKFSDGVMVDGFSKNELGTPSHLDCWYYGGKLTIPSSAIVNHPKILKTTRTNSKLSTSREIESSV